MLYCHRHRGRGLSPVGVDVCRHHDDEKSNNLQNEENLRRYANPLKDEAASLGQCKAVLEEGEEFGAAAIIIKVAIVNIRSSFFRRWFRKNILQ